MNTEEITDRVGQRAGYQSSTQARTPIREVLRILGSRDLGGEASKLATQLPGEFKDMLGDQPTHAEQFDTAELIQRIGERLDMNQAQTEKAAQAVLSSITESVTEAERPSFLNSLPASRSGYTHWTR